MRTTNVPGLESTVICPRYDHISLCWQDTELEKQELTRLSSSSSTVARSNYLYLRRPKSTAPCLQVMGLPCLAKQQCTFSHLQKDKHWQCVLASLQCCMPSRTFAYLQEAQLPTRCAYCHGACPWAEVNACGHSAFLHNKGIWLAPAALC